MIFELDNFRWALGPQVTLVMTMLLLGNATVDANPPDIALASDDDNGRSEQLKLLIGWVTATNTAVYGVGSDVGVKVGSADGLNEGLMGLRLGRREGARVVGLAEGLILTVGWILMVGL